MLEEGARKLLYNNLGPTAHGELALGSSPPILEGGLLPIVSLSLSVASSGASFARWKIDYSLNGRTS